MKKRIVIVTSEFGKQGGGLSKSASNLFHLLCDMNFDVEVIISTQSIASNINSTTNSTIIHDTINVSSGGYNSSLQRDLFFRGHLNNTLYYLKDRQPNLIISFGAGLNGLFASELSCKLNCKLVVMPRGSEINLAISNAELYYYNQKCLSKASSIVSISNELIQRTKEIYYSPFCIYQVIPNEITFKSNKATKKENNNIVLGTGAKYLNEKKGIYNLIVALSILNKKSDKKFDLHLCGSIDDDLKIKYQNLIKELSLNSYVKFTGELSSDEFLKEIKNWDIALQTSPCEGFSNSIGDAISIGVPFITSNTGYIAEQINKDFPELVFENLLPESIALKIINTYFNNDIKKLFDNAVEIIKTNVQKESIYNEWKHFLDSTFTSKNHNSIKLKNDNILSLMLHDISDSKFSSVDLPKNKLSNFCTLVYELGYKLCSANEFFSSEKKSNLIVCTFDDGYKSVLQSAFPIFRQYSFTATVFVCPNHIGKTNAWNPKDKVKRFHMTLDELHKLKNEGWEIGSHGLEHISFHRLDENEILNSATKSKIFLEKEFGEIHSFAYPYGDSSPIIEAIIRKHYDNVFNTDKGGTHIMLDRHRIKRYLFDELQSLFIE